MDFTPRYVPHSLFSFFRMTTQSLSEVRCFTPLESVECSCLLPASVIVNPNVFVGQARSLLCIATIWLEVGASEVKTWLKNSCREVGWRGVNEGG